MCLSVFWTRSDGLYDWGQRAAEDRALTARALAHLAGRFSKDSWNRDHIDHGDLALLVWSFAEMPTTVAFGEGRRVGQPVDCAGGAGFEDFHEGKKALGALSVPVRRHAEDFTPEELISVIVSYEKAYDECWRDYPVSPFAIESECRSTRKDADERFRLRVSEAENAIRDACGAAKSVLHALAPVVLHDPDAFTAEELGFVADACSRRVLLNPEERRRRVP